MVNFVVEASETLLRILQRHAELRSVTVCVEVVKTIGCMVRGHARTHAHARRLSLARRPFCCPLSRSFVRSFVRSFICFLFDCSFVRLFVRSFTRSAIHSLFIRSFMRPFIHIHQGYHGLDVVIRYVRACVRVCARVRRGGLLSRRVGSAC